jgi:hypothetical protein
MTKALITAAFIWISTVVPKAPVAPSADQCIPADKCCRVCDEGKACGKTCIAKNKTCHVGRGCACNAAEVCAN